MVEQLKHLLRDQLALLQAADIGSADRVLKESLAAAPELPETAELVIRYVGQKGYC